MQNELKSAVEAAVAMAGGRVDEVSDIYGMPRTDRVTVVLHGDKFGAKGGYADLHARGMEVRRALKAAGFGCGKATGRACDYHMGYAHKWVYSFVCGVAE